MINDEKQLEAIHTLKDLNQQFMQLMSEGKHEEAGEILERMMCVNLHER